MPASKGIQHLSKNSLFAPPWQASIGGKMLEIGQGKAMGFAINTQLMVASKVTALGMTEIVIRADIPLPTTIHGR